MGNLVAEVDKKRIKSFFWELTILRMWIASAICFGIYKLGTPFISLWVGPEYLLPQAPFMLLIIITFINLSRTNDVFINAYGLFQDIWAPVVEATLNLGLSVLLGYYFGLTGILTGVLISLLLVIYSWKPYFLYRYGFKESIGEYILHYIKYLCLIICAWWLSEYIIDNYIHFSVNTYFKWSAYAMVTVAVYGLFSLTILGVTDKSARDFLRRIRRIMLKR